VGSLETGKNADLVVLDSESYQVVAVMRRGAWVSGGDRFATVTTG
ncbi:N-acetylglucosamine-6-phosphate deacetylase, partial [Kitasatospora indigofera]